MTLDVIWKSKSVHHECHDLKTDFEDTTQLRRTCVHGRHCPTWTEISMDIAADETTRRRREKMRHETRDEIRDQWDERWLFPAWQHMNCNTKQFCKELLFTEINHITCRSSWSFQSASIETIISEFTWNEERACSRCRTRSDTVFLGTMYDICVRSWKSQFSWHDLKKSECLF